MAPLVVVAVARLLRQQYSFTGLIDTCASPGSAVADKVWRRKQSASRLFWPGCKLTSNTLCPRRITSADVDDFVTQEEHCG